MIINKNSLFLGFNTDGIGFLKFFKNVINKKNKSIYKNILLVGLGGSSKSILFNILNNINPCIVYIYNRNILKIKHFINKFSFLNVYYLNSFINYSKYLIFINTIPNFSFYQLFNKFNSISINYKDLYYIYKLNGLKMLYYQAIYTFKNFIYFNFVQNIFIFNKQII